MENVILNERYRVERLLGAGGLGEVYLAQDRFDRDNPSLTRPVAVKVLRVGADEYMQRKFHQEKEALSRIRHPYVVGVLDAGVLADGRPWFVMEYVEGISLRDGMALYGQPRRGVAFGLAGRWVRQLGQGLTAAHTVGVTHRDLKPDNVMLARVAENDYQVKLIDFGIAKVTQSVLSETTVGVIAGTVSYISPEQILGSATPASDVYTLGVITYELLTGRLPYRVTATALMAQLLELKEQQQRMQFPPPKALNRNIPEQVNELVCQALAFEPERRPSSAARFGEEVERLLTGGTAVAMVTGADLNAVAETATVLRTPPSQRTGELHEPGGALELESQLYIVRETDRELTQAIQRRDSIALIKGGRQMGKTSLLARGLQEARQRGVKVALTDFQRLSEAELASSETFFKALGGLLADALELDADPEAGWQVQRGATINFERFLRREILSKVDGPLVWGMDEVDRLFGRAYGSEVFGLFRAWHNARALDPNCAWRRVTLLIAYATEAHLLVSDMNQSPFNVGLRLEVKDFSFEQVAELNRRYGEPLDAETLPKFYELIGGHPYLAQKGLYEVAKHRYTPQELLTHADMDDGPYEEHLHRVWLSVRQEPVLEYSVRLVLEQRGGVTADAFHRLRSGGILIGETPERARLRCRLYKQYLGRRLRGATGTYE